MASNKTTTQELAEKARFLSDSEAAAVWQLRTLLHFGELQRLLSVPVVLESFVEFPLGDYGRIDMLLVHPDQGFTVIEAKAARDTRSSVAGIGQLCLYEAGLKSLGFDGVRPRYVRKVLAIPQYAESCMPVWQACREADVQLLHLAAWPMLRALLVAAAGGGVEEPTHD